MLLVNKFRKYYKLIISFSIFAVVVVLMGMFLTFKMKNILNEYRDKTIVYISHKEEIKELFKKIYNMERRVYERN